MKCVEGVPSGSRLELRRWYYCWQGAQDGEDDVSETVTQGEDIPKGKGGGRARVL
jgi:hypothetical protein